MVGFKVSIKIMIINVLELKVLYNS